MSLPRIVKLVLITAAVGGTVAGGYLYWMANGEGGGNFMTSDLEKAMRSPVSPAQEPGLTPGRPPAAKAPAPATQPTPAPTPMPAAAAVLTPDGDATPTAKDEAGLELNAELKEMGTWQGTLMFLPQDLERLKQSLAEPAEEPAATRPGAPHAEGSAPAQPAGPPVFTLGSIVFMPSGDWTIWVNGKKLRAKPLSPDPDLRVDAVTDTHADLTWFVKDLNRTVPRWQERLQANTAESAQPVRVEQAKGEVRFRLAPHQSFVASEMTVIEGTPAPAPPAPASPQGEAGSEAPAQSSGMPMPVGARDTNDIANQLMQQYQAVGEQMGIKSPTGNPKHK